MTICRRLCILSVVIMVLTLAGCKQDKFSPYRHMQTLIYMTSSEEFEANREYILGHASEELHEDITSRWNIDLYTDGYSIDEQSTVYEQHGANIKLYGDYTITSRSGTYKLHAFFTYEEDILVAYDIFFSQDDSQIDGYG